MKCHLCETQAELDARADAWALDGRILDVIAEAEDAAQRSGWRDTLSFIRAALVVFEEHEANARVERARAAYKAIKAAGATQAQANSFTGGVRPPEQSHGASGPKDPGDGASRGSKVTGLGAYR